MSPVLRSSMSLQRRQSSTNYWELLPPELRIIVFKMVLDPPVKGAKYIQSAYATVSREWKDLIERETFNHLILHQSDIPNLGSIVQGKRKSFVKRIWLRLELPEYDCESCNRQQSTEEFHKHKFLFTDAVWDLFALLCTWGNAEQFGVSGRGVTLELSAHSPSDSKHFFKELERRSGDTPWERNENPEKSYHDLAHGWRNGVRRKRPTYDAKMRVFGGLNGLKFDLRAPSARKMNRKLPKVKVIKELIIRRQFYRAFSVTSALQPIIKSCTQLECLSYEVWRGINKKGCLGRKIRDVEHHILFGDVFKYRRSLTRVSIFEDFTFALHGSKKRVRNPLLGNALARSSRNFTDLHVALNVDAIDFFYAFRPLYDPQDKKGMEWKRLKCLSLTSEFLDPMDHNTLIQLAAEAAQRMPHLECMELWNGERGHASVFRYQRHVERARILLLSTWRLRLSSAARASWRKVASSHGIGDLQEEHVSLDASLIKSHVSVIPYLHRGQRLLEPISLYQMQSEIDHR